MPHHHFHSPLIFVLLTYIAALAGCNSPLSVTNSSSIVSPNIYAEVQFNVSLFQSTPLQGNLFLEVIDDTTSLSLNATRYAMLPGQTSSIYALSLPVPVGSLIKYRYVYSTPDGITHTESISKSSYRIVFVPNTLSISDTIFGWDHAPYQDDQGSIVGTVVLDSGLSVGGLIVNVAGASTQTASDGSFILNGIPVGEQNLVVYSPSGRYRPFQQQAIIAANAMTPAEIRLASLPLVTVTFRVTIPPESAGLPVRIISNLDGFGNTFTELESGFNNAASLAPLLTYQADGSYSLRIQLPVGLDFRYKYSLGDGFWNSDHTAQGEFRTRQIIIPASDGFIQDVVEGWGAPSVPPYVFIVKTPPETPATDNISIQFNAFGWTPPIPMWRVDNNTWYYRLYSPWSGMEMLNYRYCRNDQCGIADDTQTAGLIGTNRSIQAGITEYSDTITDWIGLPDEKTATSIAAGEISPRGNTFLAGVEYQTSYSPLWSPYHSAALQNIRDLNANWVFMPIQWQYETLSPVVLNSSFGHTPNESEIIRISQQASSLGLSLALYPISLSAAQTNSFWDQIPSTVQWETEWQAAYRRMIISQATFSAQNQVGLLVMGEPYLMVNDRTTKEIYWRQLINDVRSIYHGKIAWAVPLTEQELILPPWVDQVDFLYLLWSVPLGKSAPEMQTRAEQIVAEVLYPAYQMTNRPIIVAVNYPSANDAANQGCIPIETTCYPFEILDQPIHDSPDLQMDLQEQLDAYSAVLNAIQPQGWVIGFVSRGYYPPVFMQDKSSSVHGKPTADALWYWYQRFLTQPGQ